MSEAIVCDICGNFQAGGRSGVLINNKTNESKDLCDTCLSSLLETHLPAIKDNASKKEQTPKENITEVQAQPA